MGVVIIDEVFCAPWSYDRSNLVAPYMEDVFPNPMAPPWSPSSLCCGASACHNVSNIRRLCSCVEEKNC